MIAKLICFALCSPLNVTNMPMWAILCLIFQCTTYTQCTHTVSHTWPSPKSPSWTQVPLCSAWQCNGKRVPNGNAHISMNNLILVRLAYLIITVIIIIKRTLSNTLGPQCNQFMFVLFSPQPIDLTFQWCKALFAHYSLLLQQSFSLQRRSAEGPLIWIIIIYDYAHIHTQYCNCIKYGN